jgi:hypothetical protein
MMWISGKTFTARHLPGLKKAYSEGGLILPQTAGPETDPANPQRRMPKKERSAGRQFPYGIANPKKINFEWIQWSGRADLNCRPLAPQASALPG